MLSTSRSSIVLATLVAIGLLGTSASADLVITVQEDAGPITTAIDLTGPPSQAGGNAAIVVPFTLNTADYQIQFLSATANQYSAANNAVPPGSEVQSSNTSVTNETGAAGHVLHITITGSGFTAPTAPPPISASSEIGGTTANNATPSSNSLTFLSTVVGSTPPGPFTPQTPSIATPSSKYDDSQYQAITGLAGPFSIIQALTIELDAKGDQVGYQATTNLIGVPEPSTMAIAGLGGLALAGYGLRRRKAKA